MVFTEKVRAPDRSYDDIRPDEQRVIPERRVGVVSRVVQGKWLFDGNG
jgi:hypothetical protein